MRNEDNDLTRVESQPLADRLDLPRPATGTLERVTKIQKQLHPTDPTYCAEPIDIDDARFLLAQISKTKNLFSQWARLKGDAQLAADIDHSALLGRLLDGKEAWPYPPPKAFSYPWYSLMDNGRDEGCEVWVRESDGRIIINQGDQFELLSSVGGEHHVQYHGVEYRVWETAPENHPWSWSIAQVPAKQSERVCRS